MIPLLKYADFCDFIDKIRIKNNKPLASKFIKVPYWLLSNLGLFIVNLFLLFIITLISVPISKSGRNKYPSSKYKKVVKEGFFYDSIEYHEI